jgi:hypothetical protein
MGYTVLIIRFRLCCCSGAAGFSCCENLAYVFGFKSAVTGVSIYDYVYDKCSQQRTPSSLPQSDRMYLP